ncbi:hypothetical protein ACNPMZ_12070 [Acinetobacter pittii]|uniref:hypothetical protein n=1 Tax=Acinetobacter pittii TaxID=48296 RepID=UPI003AA97762
MLKFIGESQSYSTLRGKFNVLNYIINFINEYYSNADISKEEDALEIYKGFSIFLFDKIKKFTGEGKSSDFDGYSLKQKILRILLQFSTNLSEEYFLSSIRKIKSDKVNRPISEFYAEAISNFFEKQLYIFEVLATYIKNNQSLPYIVDLRKYGGNKIYFDFNVRKKNSLIKDDIFYDDFNNILPINLFLEKYINDKMFVESGYSINKIKILYYSKVNRLNKLNSLKFHDCNVKVKLANIAILAFAKSLIAVTGVNESVLYELKVDKFEVLSSQKGMRAYGNKMRAGGKNISIEFGLKFVKFYKLYLELREFLLNNFEDIKTKGVEDKLLFNIPSKKNSVRDKFSKLDNNFLNQYNEDLRDVFKISPITNRMLRKNVSVNYLDISNDQLLTAEKLGNSPKVILNNYTTIAFDEIAIQLSSFYEAQNKSSILRYRYNDKIIGVNLKNNREIDKSKSTPIGQCKDYNPSLKEEFTKDSIQPNCSKFETCLFCENYVIHVNNTDIRKILSLRMLLNNIKNKTNEVDQIIYRINEILDYICIEIPFTKTTIQLINKNIEEGFLDDFWMAHLQLLVDLEEI